MKVFKLIKPAAFAVAMLWSIASNAQDPLDVPVGVMPMKFNSSFAGETDALRLSTAFSYFYMKEPSSMGRETIHHSLGYQASLDKFIPAIKSGIGFAVGNGSYQNRDSYLGEDDIFRRYHFFIGAAIAPKFSIKGKYTLSPSLNIGFSKVRISDISELSQENSHYNHLSSSLGLLFNTQKYYVGSSFHLFSYRWFSGLKPLFLSPRFAFNLQAGYSFQRSQDSKFSFTPQFFISVAEFDLINRWVTILPNLSFRYTQFLAGVNHTGVHVGYQTEKLRILFSAAPWQRGDRVPFSSGNLATRYIFKD